MARATMKCFLLLSFVGRAATSEISLETGSQTLTYSPLSRARVLAVPIANDAENAEYEHSSFWDDNGPLLRDAWKEWEQSTYTESAVSEEFINLMDPSFSEALEKAFANPSEETEANVLSHWSTSYKNSDNETQPLPYGVYATQLLTPTGIFIIRNLLDKAEDSGIPKRRPNGMNRNGFILDREVNGAVPMKSLIDLVEQEIINRVLRPVGRMLFNEYIGCGDDVEYFAFNIRYDGSKDTCNELMQTQDVMLKEHRDASVVTMNINLNLPNETYDGSDVFFREFPSESFGEQAVPYRSDTSLVRFNPGVAIIHLGAHRHGSVPISASSSNSSSGRRYNLVIWLFGKDGDVRIAPYPKEEQMSIVQRWKGCDDLSKQ